MGCILMVTTERLYELFRYDSKTGYLVRRSTGKVAGSRHAKGYRQIAIDRQGYLLHRVIWFFVYGFWPPSQIDHINRQRDDNRITNLRMATQSENNANQPVRKDNQTSGLKGVTLHRKTGLWRARLKKDSREISLGYFNTPEEAHAAYCKAASETFGEFARSA